MKHKTKNPTANELKSQIIRRHGTISAFATTINHRVATVYSAIKYRRNGSVARAIRKAIQ